MRRSAYLCLPHRQQIITPAIYPNSGSISDSITTFFITCERQVCSRVGNRDLGCCTARKRRHERILKVWRSDLQLVLEMPRQGVIINSKLAHRLCERCFPGDAGGITGDGRNRLRHRAAAFASVKEEILKRMEQWPAYDMCRFWRGVVTAE